jgi:hypothetical protein
MHVHANQINPNAQLDATYSAQKSEAKREAARTRKKLSESASETAGEAEAEACIVELEGSEDLQERANRQNRPGRGKKQEELPGAEEDAQSISDWA